MRSRLSRGRRILSCLLLLAVAAPTAAAEQDTGPDFTERELEALKNLPKIPKRQQRKPGELAFAVFSYGKNGEDYFYLRDKKPERLLFNTGVVRRFQFGGEDGRIVIYKRIVDEEGEAQLARVTTVTPPAGSRDGIVIFQPRDKDGTGDSRKAGYVDLSKSAFGTNEIRLINMTRNDLVVQLGKKPVKLAPLKDLVRRHRNDAGLLPVKIGTKTDSRFEVLYSNFIQAENGKRILLMIVPDWTNSSAGTPIRCMTYKDKGKIRN